MQTASDSKRHLEYLDVISRRYDEAREAGMNHESAERFAESSFDIGTFRQMVNGGCAPDLLARIVR